MREIVAFEQQRFACELCERIGEAVAEIQLGWMAAAFAEIAIGPCNSSLRFGQGSMMICLIRSSNLRLAMGRGLRLC